MQIRVLTLFPELFSEFQKHGLITRAVGSGALEISTSHLREFAINTHGQIDDTPYGGGSGMVLRTESGSAAIRASKKELPNAKVILLSPRGKRLTQQKVRSLVSDHLENGTDYILLSPRYEGVDERLIESEVDEEISIGDYVLMGGEVAAMVLIESLARLLPGVLNNQESAETESFEQGLLEYPHYTKPQEFEGKGVPEILLSGNHQKISTWRDEMSLRETERRRPDLFTGPVRPKGEVSLALMHYPVLGKQGEVITSSLTNIDIHDIARSCRTYGLKRFYIVHPVKALRKLAERITGHWLEGFGSTYNPNRKEALELISLVPDLDDVLGDIEQRTGELPKLTVTSAIELSDTIPYSQYREQLLKETGPQLILFGTGWGMAPELLNRADIKLEPIVGPTNWNHLSVRAAAAITLDRLFGGAKGGLKNYSD
jgi:tRNA (guanine37-N1)-methyltransferase